MKALKTVMAENGWLNQGLVCGLAMINFLLHTTDECNRSCGELTTKLNK